MTRRLHGASALGGLVGIARYYVVRPQYEGVRQRVVNVFVAWLQAETIAPGSVLR